MLEENTLLLHIGMPKSGTSSIQAGLAATRNLLLAGPDPVIYPVAGTVPTALAHHVLGWEYSKYMPGRPRPATNKVFEEIRDSPSTRAIVSSEHLFACEPEIVRAHLLSALPAGWSARAVAYARSPASAVLSLTDQEVARRWDAAPYEQVIQRHAEAFFLHRALTAWDREMPGHLHVRPFKRSKLTDGDAVVDFFSQWLGADHPATRAARDLPAANMGRNGALVLLIDRTRPLVREHLADIPDVCNQNANRLMRFITEALLPSMPNTPVQLRWSRRLLEACYDDTIVGLRELDDRWFGEPLLAADMEQAMASVEPGASLLTAEEALGLSAADVGQISVKAARAASNRFRRVMERIKSSQ